MIYRLNIKNQGRITNHRKTYGQKIKNIYKSGKLHSMRLKLRKKQRKLKNLQTAKRYFKLNVRLRVKNS